jgi:hypothetical protein
MLPCYGWLSVNLLIAASNNSCFFFYMPLRTSSNGSTGRMMRKFCIILLCECVCVWVQSNPVLLGVKRRRLTAWTKSRLVWVSFVPILKLFLRVSFLDDFIVHRSRNLNYNTHKGGEDTFAPLCASFTFHSSSGSKIRNRLTITRPLMLHS